MQNNVKTILVTGAAGYIGSITCDELLAQGHKIVAVDNLSRGYHDAIQYLQKKFGSEKITFYKKDLCDGIGDILAQHMDIEVCVHFAALLNVGESWQMPDVYMTNNLGGTTTLLNDLLAAGIKKIVFSSSCTVYGNAKYLPIDELHPTETPVSPYGKSKKLCEELLQDYSKTRGLHYVSLRYFNVCGATDDGMLGDSKKPSFHLVQNCVRGALGLQNFELNFARVDTPDTSPIRDYVNVVDLAIAHLRAIEWLANNNSSEIFNIGTGIGNSVYEIIEEVKKQTGVDFPVSQSASPRAGEADRMVASFTKARNILGWEPKRSLEASIKSLITWYNGHKNGWEK